MLPRHPRRTLRLILGALLAAVLSSCGFNYATDRVNTLTAGTFDRSLEVDVLNAVVVSGQAGSGTLTGLLVNNNVEEAGVLTAVTASSSEEPPEFEPLEVPANDAVQLSDAGIRIEGVEQGDFVDITFTFRNGDEVTFGVPVYPECDEYVGYDDAPGAPNDAEAYSCEPPATPGHE